MALRAIENALSVGLYTVSSIVVDGKNFEELEEYIHYMGQVGVHGIRILDIVPPAHPLISRPFRRSKAAINRNS